jgi:hypothetical protein
VLQETVDEVERVQGTGLPLTGTRIGVDETDLVVFEADDTPIADTCTCAALRRKVWRPGKRKAPGT